MLNSTHLHSINLKKIKKGGWKLLQPTYTSENRMLLLKSGSINDRERKRVSTQDQTSKQATAILLQVNLFSTVDISIRIDLIL